MLTFGGLAGADAGVQEEGGGDTQGVVGVGMGVGTGAGVGGVSF